MVVSERARTQNTPMQSRHPGAFDKGSARLLLALSLTTTHVSATEYWVEPGASGDGTQEAPWGSLDTALASAEDGDVVWLHAGEYGELSVSDAHHTTLVTIAAIDRESPRFSAVRIHDATGIKLRGLFVSSEAAGTLMELSGERLVVEECTLMSTEDTSDWSAKDWIERASSGIQAEGTDITLRGNVLKNVAYGISVGATHSLIEHNLVENFSRDGLRGLGDYSVFQYNTVKNSYAVDDHHDDGFQSWSVGDDGVGTGEVVGIVLRGNTFINYEDPEQPHRGTLQGIGCFDGTFVDWLVENNVVMTDHWHGITLLGARNSIVRNNTVIDLDNESPGPPWISVNDHKDGTPPVGCAVYNNLTTDLDNADAVREEQNLLVDMSELDSYFVDAANHDLHLVPGAPAIDAGMDTGPEQDRDGIPRPQGNGMDVGAYEWHDGTLEPSGGTAGMPATAAATGAGGSAGADGNATSASSGGSGVTSSGITSNSGGTSSGDTGASASTSSGATSDDDGGCGCRASGGPTSNAHAQALLALSLLALHRRRRISP